MCWNITISLVSASIAWMVCIYLLYRKYSPRDAWYARYLFTFTLTQLTDIVLWSLNDSSEHNGLKACIPYQMQFGSAPPSDQQVNFYVSKYIIPLIVFSQHAMQCTFPSKYYKNKRKEMILLHLIPVAIMSFCFACTRITKSYFPVPHATLFWGGDFTMWPYWLIQFGACMHSGLVAFVMYLLLPKKVSNVHNFVLLCVVLTLLITEGRMDLGSKWCSYCLIYSFVYLNDCFLTAKDLKNIENEMKEL